MPVIDSLAMDSATLITCGSQISLEVKDDISVYPPVSVLAITRFTDAWTYVLQRLLMDLNEDGKPLLNLQDTVSAWEMSILLTQPSCLSQHITWAAPITLTEENWLFPTTCRQRGSRTEILKIDSETRRPTCHWKN